MCSNVRRRMRLEQGRQFVLNLGKVTLQIGVIVASFWFNQPRIGRNCTFDRVQELDEANAQIIPLFQCQRIIHWYVTQ